MKFFFLIFLLFATPALAAIDAPSDILPDNALEARAQDLFQELKCPVCEGQSIASSDADLAKNMRNLIRKQVSLNLSDEQILEFLEQRYGTEIRMTPGFNKMTVALWFIPFIIFLMGSGFVIGLYGHRASYKKRLAKEKAQAQEHKE